MLYDPIHFAVFLIISFLLPTLLYTSYILQGLYLILGEAYIDVSNKKEYNGNKLFFSSLCCHAGERKQTTMTTWRRNLSTSGEFPFSYGEKARALFTRLLYL